MAGYYPVYPVNVYTNAAVWGQWNNVYCQGAATTVNTVYANEVVWQHWNYYQYQGAVSYGSGSTTVGLEQPPLSEQERREMAERVNAQVNARTRAKELLVSILDDNQKQQFEKDNSFELQVNDRLYRIKPGHGVVRLNPTTKKVESSFCIHPPHSFNLPPEDVAVGHKLLLEADEKTFLKIANETRAA